MSDWVIAVIALVIGLVALTGIAMLWDIRSYGKGKHYDTPKKNRHGR